MQPHLHWSAGYLSFASDIIPAGSLDPLGAEISRIAAKSDGKPQDVVDFVEPPHDGGNIIPPASQARCLQRSRSS